MFQPPSAKDDLPPGTTPSPAPEPDPTVNDGSPPGVLAPLRHSAFRIIWIANLFANLGVWAQSVAAAWIVTTEQSSPVLVAMIQVAAALPLVVLSILTGVLADNYDRRKVMLLGMALELGMGVVITALAFAGKLHPVTLIIAVFFVSVGSAIITPAWQAAVGEQVPRPEIGRAVLLNSVNFNVARALGPALGGMLLGAVGAPWVFLLNCLCFASLMWAIWRWRRTVPVRSLPPERIVEGVVAALRFTEHSNVTRQVMQRAFTFGISASALWALLPLLAYDHADGSASLYGYMLGALGLGAISGSLWVSSAQRRLGSARLITAGCALLSACLVIIGMFDLLSLIFPALLLAGSCWIAVLATYNTSIQVLVPDWVKARALALYQTALFGGLALGSFAWGHFAETLGVQGSLLAAGLTLGLTTLLFSRTHLPNLNETQDLAAWPVASEAPRAQDFDPAHGAIIVSVQYVIEHDKQAAFLGSIPALRRMRMRNGADQWQAFRDLNEPTIWAEVFVVDNWLQYLRMIDRLTLADKMVLDAVNAFHSGAQPPKISQGVSYQAIRERSSRVA
ncbi:MFS transporter [Bordetella trematum]|uniref:MFS transporter n=1 Tax=Bordetella trematum TaxID=123899 RepID=UPI000D944924|nr:MFS transporter [Bordetella trematum]SPU50921.1 transporter [Bordetella trematum]VDH07167.1 enterobactin exporter EntS [Bordetella trematum]